MLRGTVLNGHRRNNGLVVCWNSVGGCRSAGLGLSCHSCVWAFCFLLGMVMSGKIVLFTNLLFMIYDF